MKMTLNAAVPALIGLFAPGLFSQAPQPPVPAEKTPVTAVAASPCPTIQIQGSTGKLVRDGQPVTFIANIAGGDPSIVPTIVWNTSAGSIVSGQGTRNIHVDSTGAGSNREIVADLWVGGLAPECTSQASASVRVAGPPAKVEEFGDLPVEKENERLAAFLSGLPQANDRIVVIGYAGRNNVRGFAGNGLRRIRTQLAEQGISAERISVTDGGFREEPIYEFWLVPEGSDAPRPTPTIDRKDIVFPKATPVRNTPARKP